MRTFAILLCTRVMLSFSPLINVNLPICPRRGRGEQAVRLELQAQSRRDGVTICALFCGALAGLELWRWVGTQTKKTILGEPRSTALLLDGGLGRGQLPVNHPRKHFQRK